MKLFRTLFDTSQHPAAYVAKASLLSMFLCILAVVALAILFPDHESPQFDDNPWKMFTAVVCASPVVETLLMWPVIALTGRFVRSTWRIALISAAFWALAHSLVVPSWGFSIFGLFVVLSVCFVEWRKKSLWMALLLTTCIHALQNLVAFSLVQFS